MLSSPPNNIRDAFNFVFELTKQLITIAVAGIGFLLGLSYAVGLPTVSALAFWTILIVLDISVIA
jgi:hypothetical protein